MLSEFRLLIIMCTLSKTAYSFSRPDTIFYQEYNPANESFSSVKTVDTKCNLLPDSFVDKLIDPDIIKVCWDVESTSIIMDTLVLETGINKNNSYFSLPEWLKRNGYPYRSLNEIAQRLHIPTCCRSDVKDPKKLRKRFNTFSSVVRKLVRIDALDLIDSILF